MNGIQAVAVAVATVPEKNNVSASTLESVQSTLVPLAERALKLAHQLESQIEKPPTFHDDTLAELPAEVEHIRMELIDAADELTMLARGSAGPFGRIQTVSSTYVGLVCFFTTSC